MEEGEGDLGMRKEDWCLSVQGFLTFDLCLWWKALLIKVEKGWWW